MITLFLLLKLLFGSSKDNYHNDFDEEEEDFEEMYMMGMFDED